MKRQFNKIEYDTEKCKVILSSDHMKCCTFPRSFRFDFAVLCQTYTGEFFLHGKGFYGCNTIVPMTNEEAETWKRWAETTNLESTLA